MSYTITQARDVVRRSVVHAGNDTFDPPKADDAIKAVVNRFLRVTGHNRIRKTFPITNATRSMTLGDGFVPEAVSGAAFVEIDGQRHDLEWVSEFNLHNMIRDEPTQTGRPEYVSFISPTIADVHPIADQDYTVTVTLAEAFVLDTGTPEDTVLPIDDRYVYDVLWFGARAYMLLGASGHGDAGPAMQEFDRFLEEIRGQANPSGVWLTGAAQDY